MKNTSEGKNVCLLSRRLQKALTSSPEEGPQQYWGGGWLSGAQLTSCEDEGAKVSQLLDGWSGQGHRQHDIWSSWHPSGDHIGRGLLSFWRAFSCDRSRELGFAGRRKLVGRRLHERGDWDVFTARASSLIYRPWVNLQCHVSGQGYFWTKYTTQKVML